MTNKKDSNTSEQSLISDAELESLVRGKTLLVYLFAIRSKAAVGVREVQRAFHQTWCFEDY